MTSPVLLLPQNTGVSISIPTGSVGVGIIRVPTALSLRYKLQHNGQQITGQSCTVGWGPGIGGNASIRFSEQFNDPFSNSSGDNSGWGLTSSYTTPPFLKPFGGTMSFTNYFNGAYSLSGGPATVGGSPSINFTVGYTFKW